MYVCVCVCVCVCAFLCVPACVCCHVFVRIWEKEIGGGVRVRSCVYVSESLVRVFVGCR